MGFQFHTEPIAKWVTIMIGLLPPPWKINAVHPILRPFGLILNQVLKHFGHFLNMVFVAMPAISGMTLNFIEFKQRNSEVNNSTFDDFNVTHDFNGTSAEDFDTIIPAFACSPTTLAVHYLYSTSSLHLVLSFFIFRNLHGDEFFRFTTDLFSTDIKECATYSEPIAYKIGFPILVISLGIIEGTLFFMLDQFTRVDKEHIAEFLFLFTRFCQNFGSLFMSSLLLFYVSKTCFLDRGITMKVCQMFQQLSVASLSKDHKEKTLNDGYCLILKSIHRQRHFNSAFSTIISVTVIHKGMGMVMGILGVATTWSHGWTLEYCTKVALLMLNVHTILLFSSGPHHGRAEVN